MSLRTETIQVSGIRCERCVGRLAGALRDHEGLEAANANLMGQVSLTWDEDRTSWWESLRREAAGKTPRPSGPDAARWRRIWEASRPLPNRIRSRAWSGNGAGER